MFDSRLSKNLLKLVRSDFGFGNEFGAHVGGGDFVWLSETLLQKVDRFRIIGIVWSQTG